MNTQVSILCLYLFSIQKYNTNKDVGFNLPTYSREFYNLHLFELIIKVTVNYTVTIFRRFHSLSFMFRSLNIDLIIIISFTCRSTAIQVRGVPEGVQAQAPPDGAPAPAHRRETVPVLQVPQEVLPLRLLQPAHEPQVRHLQALQELGLGYDLGNRGTVKLVFSMGGHAA